MNSSQSDFLTKKDVLSVTNDSFLLELVPIPVRSQSVICLKPGKRHCIGESLARDELFLIFTRLIQVNSFNLLLSVREKIFSTVSLNLFSPHLLKNILALHLLCLPWNGSTITPPCCWIHSCAKVKFTQS